MATNVKVKTAGPLFDKARREGLLREGVKAGTKKLLPRVQDAVTGKLDSSLKAPTGRYRRTITSKIYDSGTGVVKSKDKRQIKTWLETRRRGGQRLGKGAWAWRAGKRLAATENKAGYFEAEIARRLRG